MDETSITDDLLSYNSGLGGDTGYTGYDAGSNAASQSMDDFISNSQTTGDYLTGEDPNTYDTLSNQQSFGDMMSDNGGYGWETNNGTGTVWATGDPIVDEANFGY
jgi:hypothetical protein